MDKPPKEKYRRPAQFLDRVDGHASKAGKHIGDNVCLGHRFSVVFGSPTGSGIDPTGETANIDDILSSCMGMPDPVRHAKQLDHQA
ncbi:hypothetical protein DSCW_43200 [Desulfosarcina widdelii]|uniref:Uncharacterized protein n=1 Tax=Desulfosarcina widdelii TaxID=947919 RepID=A0A5K7ZAT0_9BACT|nr:hypothetical protein DSCW_43200 [Desulfosarcina widdelii]